MSKAAKPRPEDMIGCNVKPGHQPGGMSSPLRGAGRKSKSRRSHHKPSAETVKAAAELALQKRGFVQSPSVWERTVPMPNGHPNGPANGSNP